MNPLDEFVISFNSGYSSLTSLLTQIGATNPPQVFDPLSLTVTEYLAVLDGYEQALRSITQEQIDGLSPFLIQGQSAENQAIIAALGVGDYDTALAPINEARAFVDGAPADQSMRDFIIASNPDYDFDAVGGGGTGGGDGGDGGDGGTGGDGGSGDPVADFFTTLEGELEALLWSGDSSGFDSPVFTIDEETGSWSSQTGDGTPISGATSDSFYSQLGEAAARATLSYINAQPGLVETLTGSGTDTADFISAREAAETAAKNAFEALQAIGATLGSGGDAATGLGADAQAAVDAFLAAFNDQLPISEQLLEDVALGSRNSDPSFALQFEGGLSGSNEGDWFYLTQNADVFDGGIGQDLLFGLRGNDSLSGGAEQDWLFGGDGEDTLDGGSGNDLISGGAGNDTIDGGSGADDVAQYDGAMGRFTLELNADGSLIVEDRGSTGEGRDVLTGVEHLQFGSGATIFTDGLLDLSIIQGITTLDTAEINTFVELYIAYFNRAPDALGLAFWGSAFANGTSLEQMAEYFLDQDETRATYPEDAANADFAAQVYANVLGRTPDQAGLDFWVGQLDSGNVSRDAFILEVLRGAKADPQPGADQAFIDLQLEDRSYLATKTDIGSYYALIKGLSDVDDARQSMQVFERGDTASVQEAVNLIDAHATLSTLEGSGELIIQVVGVIDDPFA